MEPTRPLLTDQIISPEAMSRTRAGLPSFMLYELYYRLVMMAVLTPLLAWLAASLVRLSGTGSVNNEDVIAFLITPVGIGTFLAVAALSVAVVFIEWAGLFDLLDTPPAYRTRPAMMALYRGVAMVPHFAVLGLIQLAIAAIVMIPLAASLAILHATLLSQYDIHYYIHVWPTEFIVALAIAIPFVVVSAFVAIALFVRWSFALPLVMLEGRSPQQALRESAVLTRGRKMHIGFTLLVWWVGCLLFGAGASALLRWTGGEAMTIIPNRLGLQVVALGGIFAFHVAAGFLGWAVVITGHTAIVWGFFRRAVPRPIATEMPACVIHDPKRFSNVLWLGALTLVVVAVVGAWSILNASSQPHHVTIYAHRGASAFAPENTLAAVAEAANQGADGAEIDIQPSSDGVPVLYHDKDLKRITGRDEIIGDLPYAELRQIDIGSWFGEDQTFAGERIATLSQAIDTAHKHGLRLNIELKYHRDEPEFAQTVADIIRKKMFADQCIITSTSADGLMQIKEIMPELQVGLILAVSVGNPARIETDFISAARGKATPTFVKKRRKQGKVVYVWTVNERKDMVHFTQMGVAGLITDRPGEARAVVTAYEELARPERMLLAFRQWLAE